MALNALENDTFARPAGAGDYAGLPESVQRGVVSLLPIVGQACANFRRAGDMEPGFYEVTAIKSPVGVGVTGAAYCELGGILKVDTAGAAYTVANEYVASRLALLLGLPVPPGTVVKLKNGDLGYAMMKFGLAGDSPPPMDAAAFVAHRPYLAAGIVLFDAWILNADRHSGNIAYIPPSRDLVSVFDHSHCLLGIHKGKAVDRLTALIDDTHLGHGALVAHLKKTTDLESIAGQIAGIRETTIREICRPLSGLGVCTKAERDKLVEVLIHRSKALRDFVIRDRAKFTGISDDDWGLV
ncbi:hypothetical protein ACOACO_18450 [Nocardioides sp. CPCC 205120]|uniref:hypothetical protein n=1 Tax=Nocardioides sp. CPCC 205120 TaxID=3406462 RepID=UPI003B50AF64